MANDEAKLQDCSECQLTSILLMSLLERKCAMASSVVVAGAVPEQITHKLLDMTGAKHKCR
jgi:hypothetical protein